MKNFCILKEMSFEEGSKEQLKYADYRDYIIGKYLRLIYICLT